MINTIKTTAVIRVDANNVIGIGHVMRCIAVGEQLFKQGSEVVFLCNEIPESLQKEICSRGFALKHLPNSEVDISNTMQCIQDVNAQYLIVDGYHLSDQFLHQASQMGVFTIRFDDILQDASSSAHIVINVSPTANYKRYQKWAPNAKLLLGSKYFAFREEIINSFQSNNKSQCEKPASIFLNFGGSDPLNLSYSVALALSQKIPDAIINIVTGAAYKEPNRLNAISQGNIRHFHDINNISELMVSASLAISAGGGTIAELELYKVPTILVITANNQTGAANETWCRVVHNSLNKKTFIDNITEAATELWYNKTNRDQLLTGINEELDCSGAERIVKEILNLGRAVYDK